MFIATQDGLITNSKWWKQMRVDGDQIVVSGEPQEGEAEAQTILIATVVNEDTKQALFQELNAGIFNNRKHFDVLEWADAYQAASNG